MRHDYDSSGLFGPAPAPAVDVLLEWGGRQSRVRALVDTGASVTGIAWAEYKRLRLPKIGDSEPIGGIADAKADPSVVNITFEGTPFQNFPVVATEQLTVTVIGRDLLNRYLLECNGPSLELSITSP
jgi:predicted aspartyl protease